MKMEIVRASDLDSYRINRWSKVPRVKGGRFNGVFNGGVFCCFKPWKVCFLWAPFVGDKNH